jgi:hypothetical protein
MACDILCLALANRYYEEEVIATDILPSVPVALLRLFHSSRLIGWVCQFGCQLRPVVRHRVRVASDADWFISGVVAYHSNRPALRHKHKKTGTALLRCYFQFVSPQLLAILPPACSLSSPAQWYADHTSSSFQFPYPPE